MGKSSTIVKCDAGVPQGAIVSPPLFSLYTDALRVPNAGSLYKYADDQALLQGVSNLCDSQNLQSNLDYIHTWCTSKSLLLNLTKCKEITFTLQKKALKQTLLYVCFPLHISQIPIENVETFKYLGVVFSSDLSWYSHVLSVFSKIRRLSYFIRRLRSFKTPPSHLMLFVTLCAVPLILYCSPVIFSGMMAKDFVLLRRSIRLLSTTSGLPYVELLDFILEKHFKSCDRLSHVILNDATHPLYTFLDCCRSKRNLRSTMTCMHSRTSRHRNSIVPYLARYLISKNNCMIELKSKLS